MAASRGYSPVVVHGLLTAVTVLVAGHKGAQVSVVSGHRLRR